MTPTDNWALPPTNTSRPPSETIDWVESQLRASVTTAVVLVGGISSAIHRLSLDDGRTVVLRRHTNTAWVAREPNIARDEERNLAMLANIDVGVDTPRLLAADPTAEHCDVPTLIMTEVAGRPDIDPAEPDRWAERLAACLAAIHRAPIPSGVNSGSVVDIDVDSDVGIGEYSRWDDPATPVPSWAEDHDLWHRAKEKSAQPLPRDLPTFLHRDFHPNNVHWQDGEICAVVDWLGACVGPAAADVAHCRWNLAVLVGPETAEHFTEHYRSLTGFKHQSEPFDLATVLSAPVGPFPTHAWNALGRTDLSPQVVAARIETWLRWVISR